MGYNDDSDSEDLISVPLSPQDLYKHRHNPNDPIGQEWSSLCCIFDIPEAGISRLPCNLAKNRYGGGFAFDSSRVVLSNPVGHSNGASHTNHLDEHNYINANYCPSRNLPKSYIATQAPLKNTINDFWLMVWQQKCSVIVMLTNLLEGGRKKADQYWPDISNPQGLSEEFGPIRVDIISEIFDSECNEIIIRRFSLSTNSEPNKTFEVTHIQYIGWPDHGVPEGTRGFVRVIKLVEEFFPYAPSRDELESPLLVHCSAGVGRAGTFIAAHSEIQAWLESKNESEGPPFFFDIPTTVSRLRNVRYMMVQQPEQYEFLYEVLHEFVSLYS